MLRRRLIGMLCLASGCVLVALWLARESVSDSAREAEVGHLRRLLPANARDDIARIRLVNAAGSFELQRVNDGYEIVQPIRTVADRATVQGILDHAFGLEQNPLPGKVDLSSVGLDPPMHMLEVSSSSGETWRLTVGRRNTFDDTVYVRAGESATVGSAPVALQYQVMVGLFQLRERKLLPVAAHDVMAVRVSGPKGNWHFVRDGEDFRFADEPRSLVDPEQAQRLIRDLTSIRVTSFVIESATPEALIGAGSSDGAMRVEVRTTQGSQLIVFGANNPNHAEQVFVHASGLASVASVAASALRSLYDASHVSLRDRRVIGFERESVYGIVLRDADGSVRLERILKPEVGRDGWRLLAPEPGPASDAEVFGLLFRLWTLRFDPNLFVDADSAPARAGLRVPRREVRLYDRDGSPMAGFSVGDVELDGAWVRGAAGRVGKVVPGRIEAISFAPVTYRFAEK